MGGRGANYKIKGSKKSIAKNAVIVRRKLKDYLLNPAKSNGKYKIFNKLGYNMKNWKRLEMDLRQGLNKAVKEEQLKFIRNNSHGESIYNAKVVLGFGKKKDEIVTGWFVKDKKGNLHFSTVIPKKGKKHD